MLLSSGLLRTHHYPSGSVYKVFLNPLHWVSAFAAFRIAANHVVATQTQKKNCGFTPSKARQNRLQSIHRPWHQVREDCCAPQRQTVASCPSAATGGSSTSKLTAGRDRSERGKIIVSLFLRNLQMPGRHKKPTMHSTILSGLNAILLNEEDAELVNPYFNKIFRIAKVASLTHSGRRRQSTVILHQLKAWVKAKKKNTGNYYSQSHYSKN